MFPVQVLSGNFFILLWNFRMLYLSMVIFDHSFILFSKYRVDGSFMPEDNVLQFWENPLDFLLFPSVFFFSFFWLININKMMALDWSSMSFNFSSICFSYFCAIISRILPQNCAMTIIAHLFNFSSNNITTQCDLIFRAFLFYRFFIIKYVWGC